MYIKASGGGSGGTTYTSYTKSSIAVYNQSGHKWTYTFDPTKLYILEANSNSNTGRQQWLIQNGVRTVLMGNSTRGLTIDWNASTATVTITVTVAYTVTLCAIE